jgi:hypothetical protein
MPRRIGSSFADRKVRKVNGSEAYARVDDPRVNFAISTRGKHPGLDHLGIQVESQDELQEVYVADMDRRQNA